MATILVETTDADFEWMIRGVALSHRGFSLPPDGVDTDEVLTHVRAIAQTLHQAQGHTDSWMIVANDEVVGLCGYKHPPSIDGIVDIGYSISVSRRRRGHAEAAVAAILAKSKVDPRVSYVIAETAVENYASQRVLEKNGFQSLGADIDPEDGENIIRWRADVRLGTP